MVDFKRTQALELTQEVYVCPFSHALAGPLLTLCGMQKARLWKWGAVSVVSNDQALQLFFFSSYVDAVFGSMD